MKKSLTRLYLPLNVLGAFLVCLMGRSMIVFDGGGTVLRLDCACRIGKGVGWVNCCRLVKELDLGRPDTDCLPKGSIMLVTDMSD